MNSILELKNVSKTYGNFKAVDDLSLTLAEGELFGFLGPNGAGKTTTMRMIGGLILPTAGTITIEGVDIVKSPEDAKRLFGFIPDSPFIYEKLTGRELLHFLGNVYSLPKNGIKQRAQELLELFEIADFADQLIENYSHGMKQRLVFCGALIHRPRLFIIDEPMVGLDPHGALLVKKVFKQLTQELGGTIFMSTHSIDIAEELCTRIGIIHKGKLIALDETKKIVQELGGQKRDLEEVFIALTETAPTQTPEHVFRKE